MFNRFAGLLFFCAAALAIPTTYAESRPDIVVILCDDLGYGDVSCFNAKSRIQTPAFDRAAAEGVRLTDSHSPASWCTPTRYSLLTGNYPFRNGFKRDQAPVITDDEPTLPQFLQDEGYSTAMVGKWHLGFEGGHEIGHLEHRGGPVDRGFQSYFGIPRSLDIPPYYWIRDRNAVAPPTETAQANNSPDWSPIQGAFWRKGGVAPGFEFDQVTPMMKNEAVSYIEEKGSQDDRDPYFLYVPLPSPHTPWVPTREYLGQSEVKLYGDFVMQVDGVVDALLRSIESIGATRNTMVIITSDNGACWYAEDDQRTGHDASGGYRGMKGDAHEGGHRMPTIVRYPAKLPAGSTHDGLTCHADFFATIAGFLNADLPPTAARDSYDFSKTWSDSSIDSPRPDFVEQASRQNLLSIRKGDWKLIPILGSAGFTKPNRIDSTQDGPKGQLYNLADDPFETTNRYQDEPAVVKKLTALLEQRRSSDRTRP